MMKTLTFNLGLAAVVALTVASGVLQGRIRNRWGPSETMLAAAQELQRVPKSFGGAQSDHWRLKSTQPLADDAVEMLECTGYINSSYENQRTGEVVNVFVVVGPTGPIAAHTPEICMSAQNYASRDKHQRVVIHSTGEDDDEFWALSFKTKSAREDLLRVYYGWTTSDHWSAPDDPRFGFVGSPYLYKVQVESQMPAGSNLTTTDTCREFLKDFLPELRKHLISSSRQ
jgi:hypothetical protein